MTVHSFVVLSLALVYRASAVPDAVVGQMIEPVITSEDVRLFTSGDGLWVLDDDDVPVRATLDLPDSMNTYVDPEGRVVFYLFTKNATDGEVIELDNEEVLKRSSFDPDKGTVIVTHGWINSGESKSCEIVKEALMEHGEYNVVVVDWSEISRRPYVFAASHVTSVGKHVARMIDFLEAQGMNLTTLTVAGHSLGAHVVGVAGYNAKGKVNYVVGLDPALPLFTTAKSGERISTEDGQYVEIIHTNGGLLGYRRAIGVADFYPNGGSYQVGCLIDIGGSCSHSRSYKYFAESIGSEKGFYGKQCKSYLQAKLGLCKGEEGLMGGLKPRLLHSGSYHLKTERNEPYAKGKP